MLSQLFEGAQQVLNLYPLILLPSSNVTGNSLVLFTFHDSLVFRASTPSPRHFHSSLAFNGQPSGRETAQFQSYDGMHQHQVRRKG